jgi:hypothetical protein
VTLPRPDPRIALIDQKVALIATLQGKIKSGDWHFVQDVASDIRELDAKLELLDEQAVASAGGNH